MIQINAGIFTLAELLLEFGITCFRMQRVFVNKELGSDFIGYLFAFFIQADGKLTYLKS